MEQYISGEKCICCFEPQIKCECTDKEIEQATKEVE